MVTPERDRSGDLTSEVKYRLLLQISQKLSGTLELEEVLNHLLDTVRLVVAYDAAGVFVLNRAVHIPGKGPIATLIAGVAIRGFDRHKPEEDPMLRSGEGVVGWVIRTGRSAVIADVRRDTRYVEGRSQTLSEIAVPIVSNQRVIGALNLESDQVGAFTETDVEMLQFFANAAAISIEKAMLHRELLEKKAIERQLEIAREVQAGLLPEAAPQLPGYDIAAINLPTFEIGGDYYDFIPFPNSHLGIVVADVSGKGIPAALIMATFRAAIRTQVRNDFELSHIMASVNLLLTESIGAAGFVTAVYGVFDPAAGTYIYSNCGHNPPIILRADGGTDRLESGGAALGIFAEAGYETAVATVNPGDVLALYTDGVVETSDPAGNEFGCDRLERALRAASGSGAQPMIESVVAETRTFAGTQGYQDDFTLVILKRHGAPPLHPRMSQARPNNIQDQIVL